MKVSFVQGGGGIRRRKTNVSRWWGGDQAMMSDQVADVMSYREPFGEKARAKDECAFYYCCLLP